MVSDIKTLSQLEERYPIVFTYQDIFGGRHYLAQAYKQIYAFYHDGRELQFTGEFNYIGFAILTILQAETAYLNSLKSKQKIVETHARLAMKTFNEISEKLNLSEAETKTSPNMSDLLNSSTATVKTVEGVDRVDDAIDLLLEKLVFHLGLVVEDVYINYTQGKNSGERVVKLTKWYNEYFERKLCPECRSGKIHFELTTLNKYIKCHNCHYEANAHSIINGGVVSNCLADQNNHKIYAYALQEKIKEANMHFEN